MNTENPTQSTNSPITPRDTDFSQWYLDIIDAADLAAYSPVRGCMVIKPNGYALWERVQEVLNAEFKKVGVQNAYFPLLIPQRLLTKEAEHVEGFAPEVAVVTHAGGEKLDEPLVIRPTSETIMYETFKDWIHSYRDLPLLINQWANVIRWEKRTKPFLRTTEFLWQEGHTVHATFEESKAYSLQMMDVYTDFARDTMAIAGIPGTKPEHEKFAGAHTTYTFEAMMQDGKALQFATSHNLGDNFAKAFDIKYLNQDNEHAYGWQTSWGLSTRSIGGLIMSHSDDKGLVIPPNMTHKKAVIVPIYTTDEQKEKVLAVCREVSEKIGAHVDDRDTLRPGEKFYEWERRGIPVRIEIGPRDVENKQCVFVRRDTSEKATVALEEVEKALADTCTSIQNALLAESHKRLKEKVVIASTWTEFTEAIEAGNFVLAHWDRSTETAEKIKEETAATIRCIPFDTELQGSAGLCIKTGKESVSRVVFAKAY